MADIRKHCVGHLRKHDGGWGNEHRRLNVLNNTFAKWRELRGELDLISDDAVAVLLLTAYRDRIKTMSREEYNKFADHFVTRIRRYIHYINTCTLVILG